MKELMDSEMKATPKKMNDMPECDVIGLIKNQMLILEEDLREAKLEICRCGFGKGQLEWKIRERS